MYDWKDERDDAHLAHIRRPAIRPEPKARLNWNHALGLAFALGCAIGVLWVILRA